ncbi:putative 2,4-dienoyl-CoA reductase [BD1-7 clade bacterium]|uniref:Putative 2,4-dienoyl-CoA reductase n=1 Tax=BD1-7 clade bacterium TaxID=2029982 RepID=A0A5S9QTH5_9GAMM|nr:putative 2,4-dienoyl-CoA reductase [BD1-7 clade bacterium]CAA0122816.1 putative 2,4-dienoyl-CoA reductase [BD1-7 clade bacterium]
MSDTRQLDFTGNTVVVTGGGKGVGKGITERFLEQGANVVICGRNEPEAMPEANGRKAVFKSADVRDWDQVQALMQFAVDTYGSLDVLINNAGGAPFTDAATASPRFSEKIIALNLLAPLYCCQAANAIMQEQEEGGSIVNIASVSAIRPSPGTAAYGAAKAGLMNLTTSLAVEWAPKVRLNSIAAGLIRTEQSHLHYGNEEGIARVSATVPLGRMATPHDIGDTCIYFASNLSSYVTGAFITAHGGGEKPAFLDAGGVN